MGRDPKAGGRSRQASNRPGGQDADPFHPLIEALRSRPPTGPAGFEGLVGQLLSRLTGALQAVQLGDAGR
jgi:hypothetical protein